MTSGPTALVLVAHGSRDPRAAATTRALVRAVAAARPGAVVRAAYLDHAGPRPGTVLRALECAGHHRAVLVPLLLTSAYHHRVDIPEAVRVARAAGLRMAVPVADALGPTGEPADDLLVGALRGRLAEAGAPVGGPGAAGGLDAVVLAAAGTRDAAAIESVDRVAGALSDALAVPCRPAYASATPPTIGAVLADLRASGARRVAMATYFLAPGRLYESMATVARADGAVAVAAPLADSPEIARLVLARADTALARMGDGPDSAQ
ncbi:MAG TPA: CbiX/SirB N-terminal domain-containing protein [Micromonospora sp.]